MLQEETGIKGKIIDDVRVLEDFSFVTVPFEEAEIILQLFNVWRDGPFFEFFHFLFVIKNIRLIINALNN